MAYVPHEPLKDQLIVDTGLNILGEKVEVLNTMTKFSPEQYLGAQGDTISVRVKGTLPVRHYGIRNDRSQPIQTDVYKETKVDMTVQIEDAYSSVALTEEQKAFDLKGGFGDLTDAQTDTIAEDTQRQALEHLLGATFEAQVNIDPSDANIKAAMDVGRDYIYNRLDTARMVLNKLRAPADERYVRAGSEVASILRQNQRLTRTYGDAGAQALSMYDVGNIAGFQITEDPYMPADEAIVYVKSAYQFWNYAPGVPQGAAHGAIGNKNGIAMTWIVDYDSSYQVDRSTWKTWRAWGYAQDMLKQINTDKTQTLIGTEQYFLRGLKIKIGAEADGFLPGDGKAGVGGARKGASATSELGLVFTGKPFAGTLPAGNSHDYSRVADATPPVTP
ncbi:hypothetical protein AUR04nite_00490 [Glutamicibacter uratoxydans]|uniref:Major capsid protein n=1 Tax=Glutamicibacter uratoxydans TaxID=43667 RepID=A0A4Y4DIR7_GLUUR|nr:hypothetical protein [Glutamicibacter uratoxydans]GED04517.1 hypothetical protein AUR04nite_00490 [Glutamicibacter uratoxydans]